MTWKSQMQTEITLSSAKSECTGLSCALPKAILIVETLKEMKRRGFPVSSTKPKVHCKAFEDDTGAVEIARVHKHCPQTKHLNDKLHHFKDCVDCKEMSVHHAKTENQPANCMMKGVNENTLVKH